MRVLVLICGALVAACGAVDQTAEFAPGQAWRLREANLGNAVITIGAVETRGDTKIVHASISELPGPPTTLPPFSTLEPAAVGANADAARHFIASGVVDPEGNWSPLTADFTVSPDSPNTSIAIPHIAVQAQALRNAVVAEATSGMPLHQMFDANLELWRQTEQRWPQLNDNDLEKPLPTRLGTLVRHASKIAADARGAAFVGALPPSAIAADAIAVEDLALDEQCRGIVDPATRDPDAVSQMLSQGFAPEDVLDLNVTMSNAGITHDEGWGNVWRADLEDTDASGNHSARRVVCWRKTPKEFPTIALLPITK